MVCLVVLVVFVKGIQHLGKDVIRGHLVEQFHTRAQLDGINAADHDLAC